jgi:hypothetical protein
VGIDEARYDGTSAGVDDLGVRSERDARSTVVGRPDEDDTSLEAGDRCACERAYFRLSRTAARSRTCTGGDKVGILENAVGEDRRRALTAIVDRLID